MHVWIYSKNTNRQSHHPFVPAFLCGCLFRLAFARLKKKKKKEGNVSLSLSNSSSIPPAARHLRLGSTKIACIANYPLMKGGYHLGMRILRSSFSVPPPALLLYHFYLLEHAAADDEDAAVGESRALHQQPEKSAVSF